METTLPHTELTLGILYADMISAAIAKRIVHGLHGYRSDADVRIRFCSFRLLECGSGSSDLLDQLSTADVLLITSLDGWLPEHILRWLAQWISRERRHPVAIAVLMYAPQSDNFDRLRTLCGKHGVDFLECTNMQCLGERVEKTGRNNGRCANIAEGPGLPRLSRPVER